MKYYIILLFILLLLLACDSPRYEPDTTTTDSAQVDPQTDTVQHKIDSTFTLKYKP